MSPAGRKSISGCFHYGLQDGYLSLKPYVKDGLFPLTWVPAMTLVQHISALTTTQLPDGESHRSALGIPYEVPRGILPADTPRPRPH